MNARRIAFVVAIAVIAVFTFASSALAGKGKPGGTSSSSSLSLVLMDGATQAKHYGNITFNVSTSATSKPQVGLRCYQGANFVYDGYVGYWSGYMFTPYFILQSNYWVDGIWATCDARLFYSDSRGRQVILATTSFPVAP